MKPDPSCEDLAPFMDDAMSDDDAERFLVHLDACSTCQTDLDDALQIDARLSFLAEEGTLNEPGALIKTPPCRSLGAPAGWSWILWIPRFFYKVCGDCRKELSWRTPYVRDAKYPEFPICLSCAKTLWGYRDRLRVRYRTEENLQIRWRDLSRCPIETSGRSASREHPGWLVSPSLRCVLSAGHAPGCVF